MSYDEIDLTYGEARPFWLYQFSEGGERWRFTSRSRSIEIDGNVWEPAVISHGDLVTTGDLNRTQTELTFNRSNAFAQRFLEVGTSEVCTVTIFRGHEQEPSLAVAVWKGRVGTGDLDGSQIILPCEPVTAALRRVGLRAKYQKLCRHALYSDGCGADLSDFLDDATVQQAGGTVLEVDFAVSRPAGYYRGGVLRFNGEFAFIIGQSAGGLILATQMSSLLDAVAVNGPTLVRIAPGCDLRPSTCSARFSNLKNYGGFPDIPGRNPFGGGSLV